MISTLILDWSGTLVDDFTATLKATNEVFKHYGLVELSSDEFRRDFRLPYPEFYEEFLPEVPLEDLEVLFKKAFIASEHLVRPLEQTQVFLASAKKKGLRLFILSSMNEDALIRQADDFGLTGFFEAIYAGILDKREKIGQILSEHGLKPFETAYVGDMVHDVEAAKAGGVTAVALLSGYDPLPRLADAQPEVILPSVGELAQLCSCPPRQSSDRPMREDIRIRKLKVPVFIGVPKEERAKRQDVYVSVAMESARGVASLGDELKCTVDYFTVSERIKDVALSHERKLIETLAEDLVALILSEFHIQEVRVEIEKPILSNCEGVVVSLQKRRD